MKIKVGGAPIPGDVKRVEAALEIVGSSEHLAVDANAGFADDAKVEIGYLKLPDRPGIGFEAQNALYAVMRGLV